MLAQLLFRKDFRPASRKHVLLRNLKITVSTRPDGMEPGRDSKPYDAGGAPRLYRLRRSCVTIFSGPIRNSPAAATPAPWAINKSGSVGLPALTQNT